MTGSDWTQPQCERCYIALEGSTTSDRKFELKMPTTLAERRIEHCAWCCSITISGIYQRVNPTTVSFPTFDADDEPA